MLFTSIKAKNIWVILKFDINNERKYIMLIKYHAFVKQKHSGINAVESTVKPSDLFFQKLS